MEANRNILVLLEEELLINAAIAAVLVARSQRRGRMKKRKRRFWTRPWLMRRSLHGQYEALMSEMAMEDHTGFRNFQRIDPELFQEMLVRVSPRIRKQDTRMRRALDPGLRLAITLRYLATGDSYKSLEYGFRVANNSISKLVPEIGAPDDGGVFQDCTLRDALEKGKLGLPEPAPLPNDDQPVPYSIVADDAFQMRSWLMKPYPHRQMTRQQRIFNYRLSRARRVVENAFGILAHRFRCTLGTFEQDPKTVESIVLACCVLHNLLRSRYPTVANDLMDGEDPDTHEVIPGRWRKQEALTALEYLKGNNTTKAAKGQRDYLCSYYNNPVGSISWQNNMI
ncbi:uncharacterized protein LOC117118352 [Anneissia japonica]|uniref:uncharacterized protein LOC117118352 n=1 Tax=Anneissia japonica TaxID=1529436 RepID=UPI001425A5E4|nr:uncharacterized protein LOC117118352 [Anneissia japonica]